MKNVVFIPYIKREDDVTKSSSIGHSNRHSGYEYGIKSWKSWCKKHDCELYIMDELLLPESEMLITWQRWQVLNILEHNGVDYNQVLIVDADSIVHPDCPNFFKMTNNLQVFLLMVIMNGLTELSMVIPNFFSTKNFVFQHMNFL